MKPSKSNIKKWCKALRSGKYKQTKRFLQDNNGFCCLGVACDIFINKKEQVLKSNKTLYGYVPENQKASPKWLKDIEDEFANITNISLVSLNDSSELNMSFDEIADVLEAVYIHEVLD